MTDYTAIDAVNWSTLKNMLRGPAYYKWAKAHPGGDKPAYKQGRAIHCATLEPERMSEVYVQRPDHINPRTNAGKEWMAEQEAAGFEVLTPDEWELAEQCAQAVYAHEEAAALLANTERERTITGQLLGVDCKCRADACRQDAIIDLKTTRDIDQLLRRDAASYVYHGQLAFYRDLAASVNAIGEAAEGHIIAVETAAPYEVAVIRCEWWMPAGRNLYTRLLAELKECERTDTWPGKYPGVIDVDLPRWAEGVDHEDDGEDW